MAKKPEKKTWDRLLPCLLDRLTDDNPFNAKESLNQSSMKVSEYRKAVLRDLAFLLNSSSILEEENDKQFPNVSSSVINYGIRDFTGKTISKQDSYSLSQAIRKTIIKYEPRINPNSLKVNVATGKNGEYMSHHNLLQVEISGELWLTPYPEALLIKTMLDLETSEITLVNA